MIINNAWILIFAFANSITAAAYVFLAVVMVPRIKVTRLTTKISGVIFFALSAIMHVALTAQVVLHPTKSLAHTITQTYVPWIYWPQAVAAWVFIFGLYVELGRWGPWKDEQS